MYRQILPLLFAGLAAGLGSPAATAQTKPGAPATSVSVVKLQEWEVRRQRFLQNIKQLHEKDVFARRDFERQVSAFQERPFSLTPLEAMDYIGAVFVPQAGVEKLLPLIAAQAALGLYDIWRFGSSLAEAELLEGERFLRRPLSLGGPEEVAKARAFMRDNPQRTAQLVQQGLQLANGERIGPAYDPRWVRALGRCEVEAAASCPQPRDVPVVEWDDVWEKVRQRVTEYYQVEPAAPSQASSAASAPR